MIYKTLKKVSDVCQLLDKSKYPETVEIAGINFTNNGDGSFTMTGTKDGNAQLKICVADIKKGHKYLGATGTDIFFMWFYKDGTSIYGDFISSPFYTATKTSTDVQFYIKTESSDEVNVTAYPQLFDLTEMYGAGNEPTTVEQFRQDFPEEMYDYKPYCFVKSYKTLLKPSDVCQLFIPDDTHTVAGVTITNNRDGSLTIDGTGTGSGPYTNFTTLGKDNMSYKIGDKLFISAYVISGTCSFLFGGFSQSGNPIITFTNASEGTYYSGDISTQNKYEIRDYLGFYVGNNTFNNFRVKFNIINLTEMYGAGNEPTTVEEFREKFPNEFYDYKPYSIITSYKKSLVCNTKNLFDISKVTETNELKVKGNSIYSYDYPAICDDTSTLSIFKSLKPNTNYTISAVCPFYLGADTNWILIVFNNGNTIIVFENYEIGFAQKTFSLTQEQIDNIKYVYFYGRPESDGGPTIWSNIQIEEGNTATEYHPYGYL